MFINHCPILLASASPRRKELLQLLGLHFGIIPATIEETPHPNEAADHFAMRMAAEKAEQVSQQYPEACVIAADTVVTLDGIMYGKPQDPHDAFLCLQALREKTHRVITGVAVYSEKMRLQCMTHAMTQVTFAAFSDEVLKAYIHTGEPMDKAGAYGIQGAGAFLVESISGSYSNVVGLPVTLLVKILLEHKIIKPKKND